MTDDDEYIALLEQLDVIETNEALNAMQGGITKMVTAEAMIKYIKTFDQDVQLKVATELAANVGYRLVKECSIPLMVEPTEEQLQRELDNFVPLMSYAVKDREWNYDVSAIKKLHPSTYLEVAVAYRTNHRYITIKTVHNIIHYTADVVVYAWRLAAEVPPRPPLME